MNKKDDMHRRTITIKLRLSPIEYSRLKIRADEFCNGNISELIRHAITNMRVRPNKKRGPSF